MNNYFADLPESYIIAEIGVNHNGSIDFAKKLIDAALLAGANAVKFQTFTAKNLVMKGTPKVPYQNNNQAPNENHYEMLKRLELSKSNHIELFDYCKKNKIDFISTPYDVESAKFLNDLGVSIFKTASADIVDLLLHKYISSTGKPAIIAPVLIRLLLPKLTRGPIYTL